MRAFCLTWLSLLFQSTLKESADGTIPPARHPGTSIIASAASFASSRLYCSWRGGMKCDFGFGVLECTADFGSDGFTVQGPGLEAEGFGGFLCWGVWDLGPATNPTSTTSRQGMLKAEGLKFHKELMEPLILGKSLSNRREATCGNHHTQKKCCSCAGIACCSSYPSFKRNAVHAHSKSP